jgi:hypothetical protein
MESKALALEISARAVQSDMESKALALDMTARAVQTNERLANE